MSRLGKKVIPLPSGTEAIVKTGTITIKGKLGELSRSFKTDAVSVQITPEGIKVDPVSESLLALKLWGTYASHIRNMIQGVNAAYEKSLIIQGVGFKADIQGEILVLNLGFSHPVKVEIPQALTVVVAKDTIKISGISKEGVGQFAAKIRAIKKPEPYKGKGIRYSDEIILRKEGKKSATV
ncbi:MAG: 50S ribosomal protein L6 [Candidatus Pacebacteria bacterium]|nr:50S ribosomal protein L6 [Candidatus Paceibacterota bacterium]